MDTLPQNKLPTPRRKRRSSRPLFAGRATAVETAMVFLFLGLLAANVGPRLGVAADTSPRQQTLVREISTLRACIDRYKDRHGTYPDLSRSFDPLIGDGESAPALTAAPVNPITRSAAISTTPRSGNGWVYGGSSGPEAGTIFALDGTGKTLDY